MAFQDVGRSNDGRFGLFWFIGLLQLRLQCEEFLRTLDHSNPRSLVVNLLVCTFGIDLSPTFAIEATGYSAKKALVGVKPIDLIELGFVISYRTAIEAFAIFDEIANMGT